MPTRRLTADGLDGWIRQLDRRTRLTEADERRWRQATEVMFDRSQTFVHVITAALKASGRVEMSRDRRSITGAVVYGGTKDCDYAVYEFARGGDHDALLRAFVATARTFRETLADMVGG